MQDLNNCYHASNHIVGLSKHQSYENWVRDNVVVNCHTSMTYEAYRYTYDSTFIGMANNFAGLAKAGFDTCNRFDSSNSGYVSAAVNQTKNDINRTQRAVCGILNRFYYNAQLNH